jgi:malate/lactate dehydrogenase
VAVVLGERGTQQVPTISEHAGIALPDLLQQACRAFHIGEEQGDGSGW